jgi:hypothetical protein
MKEPFLAALIANESEPSVANESFDRAARHPSLLGRACPGSDYQYPFQYLNLPESPFLTQPASPAHPVADANCIACVQF